MRLSRVGRLAPAAVVLAGFGAACVDAPLPSAPSAAARSSMAATSTNPAAVAEGKLYVCKVGNASGTFTVSYSLAADDGVGSISGSVNVDAGSCVLAVSVATGVTGPNNRWTATLTETALPANWAFTSANVIYSGGQSGNWVVDPATRTVSKVRLANDLGAEVTFTNTFTPPPSGEIGDFVWHDVNGNGVQDVGEPGIAGVSVTLSGAANASTTTDANGYYLFSGLSAGSYTVTAATPAGYVPTTANQGGDPAKDSNGSPAAVTLATNSSIDHTIDFGYVVPPPPPAGCTYTQGYWKTHSEFGPAPYDNTWAKLSNGASTSFFLSGDSWIGVFRTPPKGNPYYQLAHQYMAAVLNGLNGANQSVVSGALATSTGLFNTYTPAAVAALPKSSPIRAQMTALAGSLDNYNNGITGPGHCN